MRARSFLVAALGLAALGGCDPAFDDPGADYARRSVTISPGAGNSQAANEALQTTTPWPRHSDNTHIPGNGAQMVKAIREFETGKRPPLVESGGGNIGVQINNGGAAGGGGLQQKLAAARPGKVRA